MNAPIKARDSRGAASATLRAIGMRIRKVRRARSMTLNAVASASGISTSMLSLMERGRVSPSIGSLIDVCDVLGLPMSDVIEGEGARKEEVVVHSADRRGVEHAKRVVRRILCEDRKRAVSVAIAEFPPNSDSAPIPHAHGGHEYGFVLDGKLTVEVDGQSYVLGKGDLISYDSRSRHRIWNHGKRPARTLWFNLVKPL